MHGNALVTMKKMHSSGRGNALSASIIDVSIRFVS